MFAQWIEQPYETLSWLKKRRTVFLQKTENLSNKKNIVQLLGSITVTKNLRAWFVTT